MDLIKIQYNAKDDAIDFSVPAKHDDYYREYQPQIIRMLRKLAHHLENNVYPFHLDRDKPMGETYKEITK